MTGSIGFGLIMYEKFGLHSGNQTLVDMLISVGAIIRITQSTMCLLTYRNIFGPFDNQNLVFGLQCIHIFGNVSYFMTIFQEIFVWYVTVKIFKNKCETDEVGAIEYILFHTI